MTYQNHRTPGPWEWKCLPSVRGQDWTIMSIGGLTVEAPSASLYVSCHQDDQHLLKAAPDLLDALIDMVEHGDATAFKKARAAIQKATGK